MGCRVVCAVRSEPSAEALREAILRELPAARIETVTGDLARLDAVRALAAEVARRGPVDTLVLNAGVVTAAPRDTADGLDEMLVVNHLSGFLLTAALWPVLLRGPSPRVVTVSSLMHGWGRVDPTDLGGRRGPWLGGWPQYARTKQMNVLFARELARRHAGGPVTCNALHPGSYGTGLQRGSRLSPVLHAALPGADRAGRGVVRLATSPELEGVTGGYFDVERIAAPSVLTRDTTIAAAVWEESARLVGVSPDWPV
jgi:NAD(P)-dependent dehydrogenase (short-subunit alcohol dehydrogenase family)